MIKLSVIYVLFNEFEVIIDSLKSVYSENISNMEIILLDNSTDKNGYKKVIKKFPKIKYIQSKYDLGYPNALAIGIKQAKGEFILPITPDMYLLKGTIKKTLDYLIAHSNVGAVGCRVYSGPHLHEQSAYSTYPNLLFILFYYNMLMYKLIHRINKNYNPILFSMKDHKKELKAKMISGAYFLMRKKALIDIGGYDKRFFMYFDDFDISKRLNNKGWDVMYLPIGGIVQNTIGAWKANTITQSFPYYMESLYKFFKKHNGNSYAAVAWVIATLSSAVSIPYLLGVILLKEALGKKSQATELLPLWIGILKWHLTKGVKIVF